jgi:ubiquinone/menaquinone biosynthesis C-methylase UbiE
MMSDPGAPFVPALRFHRLTRFYDPLVRLTLREARWRALLVAQASLRSGHRVLDLGCGTGSLTLMLKRACPDADVTGLDADPSVLARARRKAAAKGLAIDFREGTAVAPPFAWRSFDRIVSSLLFHHLVPDDKRQSLWEAFELLKPAGELHVADWGRPHGPLMRLAFLPGQVLDGFSTTADSVRGMLPRYMEEAGFEPVEETHRERTVFGSLAVYRALKGAGGGA